MPTQPWFPAVEGAAVEECPRTPEYASVLRSLASPELLPFCELFSSQAISVRLISFAQEIFFWLPISFCQSFSSARRIFSWSIFSQRIFCESISSRRIYDASISSLCRDACLPSALSFFDLPSLPP
ncbi:MAG TPA: hypothetical protein VFT21_01905 [Gemmatimonadaceae bacterium]|nr:hypothetical protein [Gemmatimonadaceae bacterium]